MIRLENEFYDILKLGGVDIKNQVENKSFIKADYTDLSNKNILEL